MAVERVFSQHNVKTVMGTAQASGIALLVAARRGLPVALHTPSEVKAAVTGSGRADKAQVGAMVTRLLRLERDAQAGRRRRLAGPGHLPHLARGRREPARGRGGGPAPARRGSTPMIAFVRGRVAAVALTSAVLEVGGVGLELQCTPDTLAGLRIGSEATLPTQHGGARGLPDAVRLRRRRREADVRARADRQRRRPQAGPGDARRATAPRPCAAP